MNGLVCCSNGRRIARPKDGSAPAPPCPAAMMPPPAPVMTIQPCAAISLPNVGGLAVVVVGLGRAGGAEDADLAHVAVGGEDLQRVAQLLEHLLISLMSPRLVWSRRSLSALATISPTRSPSGTSCSSAISSAAAAWTSLRSSRVSVCGRLDGLLRLLDVVVDVVGFSHGRRTRSAARGARRTFIRARIAWISAGTCFGRCNGPTTVHAVRARSTRPGERGRLARVANPMTRAAPPRRLANTRRADTYGRHEQRARRRHRAGGDGQLPRQLPPRDRRRPARRRLRRRRRARPRRSPRAWPTCRRKPTPGWPRAWPTRSARHGSPRTRRCSTPKLVDAIIIATPHFQHPEIALAAFERGMHVLSEKPLAVAREGRAAGHRRAQAAAGAEVRPRCCQMRTVAALQEAQGADRRRRAGRDHPRSPGSSPTGSARGATTPPAAGGRRGRARAAAC